MAFVNATASSVPLSPVKGQRLSTLIVEQLEAAIFSGALTDGDRLPPERELIARFQASRASVLEALHILEAKGLIEIRRGMSGGAFVKKPDFLKFSGMLNAMLQSKQFTLSDIYEARLLIEPGIAEIAARIASKSDIATLRASVEYHREIPTDQTAQVGRNFHYLLASVTQNPLLALFMSSLLGAAQVARADQPLASRKQRLLAHQQVVDAIEKRDAASAKMSLERHLRRLLKEATRASE
jgi:GntR family transcriptional repressor for pyruvate dehydrogenase complex